MRFNIFFFFAVSSFPLSSLTLGGCLKKKRFFFISLLFHFMDDVGLTWCELKGKLWYLSFHNVFFFLFLFLMRIKLYFCCTFRCWWFVTGIITILDSLLDSSGTQWMCFSFLFSFLLLFCAAYKWMWMCAIIIMVVEPQQYALIYLLCENGRIVLTGIDGDFNRFGGFMWNF